MALAPASLHSVGIPKEGGGEAQGFQWVSIGSIGGPHQVALFALSLFEVPSNKTPKVMLGMFFFNFFIKRK